MNSCPRAILCIAVAEFPVNQGTPDAEFRQAPIVVSSLIAHDVRDMRKAIPEVAGPDAGTGVSVGPDDSRKSGCGAGGGPSGRADKKFTYGKETSTGE